MTKYYLTPPFKVLVANLSGQLDSKGNPIPTRQGFQLQTVVASNGNHINLSSDADPAPSTAVVTVSNNDFTTGEARLVIGDVTLVSGLDFVQAGSTALTAVNVAAAIDALTGFTAIAVGSDVNIEGPAGPFGGEITFRALYAGTITNFTLTPTTGLFTIGAPTLNGPIIF